MQQEEEREICSSDAMEAVIGAIYLDGGFANAKEFVHRFILKDIENKKLFYDSKTILQEIVQGILRKLSYELIGEEGPDHDKQFTVAVLLESEVIGGRRPHKESGGAGGCIYSTSDFALKKNIKEVFNVFKKYEVQGFKSFANKIVSSSTMESQALSDQTEVERVMSQMRSDGYLVNRVQAASWRKHAGCYFFRYREQKAV